VCVECVLSVSSVPGVCRVCAECVPSVCRVCVTLVERTPPPRGGFLFTMIPDQEPCVRDFTTRYDRRISS